MSYWLMKSEPEVYSIEDLKRDGRTEWEGVRNYQARNFMVKEMKFYVLELKWSVLCFCMVHLGAGKQR